MTLREQLDELAPDQIAARLTAIFRAKLAEFDQDIKRAASCAIQDAAHSSQPTATVAQENT